MNNRFDCLPLDRHRQAGPMRLSIGLVIACLVLFGVHAETGECQDAVVVVADLVNQTDTAAEKDETENENIDDENEEEGEPVPLLRMLINTELSLVKRVCELSDEDMAPIVAAVTVARDAIAKIAVGLNEVNQEDPDIVVFYGEDSAFKGNPVRWVRAEIAKLLRAFLTDQQYEAYSEESRLRAEFERQGAIRLAIEAIDQRFGLSIDQRGNLKQELVKKWVDADFHVWEAHMRDLVHMTELPGLPPIPKSLIEPWLTASQRSALESYEPATFYAFIRDGESGTIGENWIK